MPGLDGIPHLFFLKVGTLFAGQLALLFQETCAFHSLDSMDKSIIYAIESAVIQWSRQVQVVLNKESSQPLFQGENPTPWVELEFWKSR